MLWNKRGILRHVMFPEAIRRIQSEAGMIVLLAERLSRPVPATIESEHVIENRHPRNGVGGSELMDKLDAKSTYFVV